MNEEDFITKFYSCDNEEQFLKDICHNLNCLQKVQNNWNTLKQKLEKTIKSIEKESLINFKKEKKCYQTVLNEMLEMEKENE